MIKISELSASFPSIELVPQETQALALFNPLKTCKSIYISPGLKIKIHRSVPTLYFVVLRTSGRTATVYLRSIH